MQLANTELEWGTDFEMVERDGTRYLQVWELQEDDNDVPQLEAYLIDVKQAANITQYPALFGQEEGDVIKENVIIEYKGDVQDRIFTWTHSQGLDLGTLITAIHNTYHNDKRSHMAEDE